MFQHNFDCNESRWCLNRIFEACATAATDNYFRNVTASNFASHLRLIDLFCLPTYQCRLIFSKMGQSQPLFCLFLSFSHYHFNNTHWKKCRWCDGIQTRGHRMVGANESTELWRPSTLPTYYAVRFLFKSDNCFDAFLKNRVKHIAGLTNKSICREKIKVNMKGKVFLSAGWWR